MCINDLQEQEKKDHTFKAVCPFGCSHTIGGSIPKLVLVDVDAKDKVKKYTDSQKESHAFADSNREKDEWFS
jgi:hypothetical protein